MGLVCLAYTFVDEEPIDYERASALMEESLEITRERGDSASIANVLQDLGGLETVGGKYTAAEARIEESLARAREIGSTRIIADGLSLKGELAFFMNEYARAESYFSEGLLLYRATGILHNVVGTLGLLTGIVYAQANVDRTVVLLGALGNLLSGQGISLMHQISARREYEATLAAVKPQLVEEPLLSLFRMGQQLSLEQTIAYVLGELEVSSLPAEASGRSRSPAVATTTIADASGTVASTIGPTLPLTDLAGLTPRETDVLSLIGAGKSNEEIASTFVLSVRTVERHINSIYQKIGATGRAARAKATAYALSHKLTN
jgi:DNA-binding CsgD family transcriptional regulator